MIRIVRTRVSSLFGLTGSGEYIIHIVGSQDGAIMDQGIFELCMRLCAQPVYGGVAGNNCLDKQRAVGERLYR